MHLQSVSGQPLKVDGLIRLKFKIGGTFCTHSFYVVPTMNRNVILGRDFLTNNGVRLYYDLGCLRINKHFVSLEEDLHIASLARLTQRVKLKPQSNTVCFVRTKFDTKTSSMFEISHIEQGFIADEPGLMLAHSITPLTSYNTLPVSICNNTNKTILLRRGCVVGRVEPLACNEISEISQSSTSLPSNLNELDLSELDCNPDFKDEIHSLILQNSSIFAKSDIDLGCTDLVSMSIDTGSHSPIKLRPYRTPLHKREEVGKAIDDMLKANVIKRSMSPWSFPLVVVSKKDGTSRMCVDFRKLNKITKPTSYPLPLIDDILSNLGHAKYFSKLDLKSGFWQIALDPKDSEKTAFACHKGLFQFNVMPFGLCNAPGTFQHLMTIALQGFEHFAAPYIDDIVIFSSSIEAHLDHIQQVFSRLQQHNLKLKLKKCSFFLKETQYLGFIINDQGVKPDPEKVKAINTLPAPTTVKQVRSFIGMCSYYRRFIPRFSAIAEPLIALTRKYARFSWDEQCQKAFDYLKENLSVIPLLHYPDLHKPFCLYTDASDQCIGACLTQPLDDNQDEIPNTLNEKPIYYLSHKLSPTQTRWSTIEKEAFAIKSHFPTPSKRPDPFLSPWV